MPRPVRRIPWLSERENGQFYVNWYDEGEKRTKRCSLGESDPVEAQKRYAAFLANGHDALKSGPANQLTVSGALLDYLEEHIKTGVVVAVRRAQDSIKRLQAHFGDVPLAEIDIPASRAYARARKAAGISDVTIRRELGVLVAAANHAAKWRRIGLTATPPGPMPSIELPRPEVKETLWLTKEEWALAINSCPEGRLKDFMNLCYYTASRRAAIEGLTRAQVDLRGNRINLTSGHETMAQRRSKKRRPWVPIDPKLRSTVERLMATGDEYLLGGTPVYDPFRRHMCAIGFINKAFPHIMRHSRATHLLQDGVSIYDVAKLLGDTVATVERTYGHHSTDYLARAIERAG